MEALAIAPHRFAVCIYNRDYEVSLERHKIYRVLPDSEGESHGYLRVVDEDEDYLYPAEWFVELTLPEAAEASIMGAGVANVARG